MLESGRDALSDVRQLSGAPRDVREALPVLRESSGDHTGCLGVVGRPTRMFGSDRETHPDVPEWLEALPDVQEWL